MNTKVVLVDYDVGNIRSITNALRKIGCEAILSRDPAIIEAADKIILPGVGSFPYCMQKLKDYGLDTCIKACVKNNTPVLGICVGMQLLFDYGEEHGGAEGLGIIAGKVKHFMQLVESEVWSDNFRLPHIEWSPVNFSKNPITSSVFNPTPLNGNYYFVHSFVCVPDKKENIFALTSYANIEFCSAVIAGNVCGVQFHPEKSGKLGLELLNRFVNSSIHG